MNDSDKKRTGKFLSLVLRHKPDLIGVSLDQNGWADVEELIQKCSKYQIYFSIDELIEIVETNDKKRYAFNFNKTKIRANQGHSIDIDLDLQVIKPPQFLYHGTSDKYYRFILNEGVKKKKRQYVHLSEDKETAYKVGSRHGKAIVLIIMSGKMYENGINFYKAANGVWLTDFVNTLYISS